MAGQAHSPILDLCPFSSFPLRNPSLPMAECHINPLSQSLLGQPLLTQLVKPDSSGQPALPLLSPLQTLKVDPSILSPTSPSQDRATEPSPTLTLKESLKRPLGDNTSMEDTWKDGLRSGFLSFSSSL